MNWEVQNKLETADSISDVVEALQRLRKAQNFSL